MYVSYLCSTLDTHTLYIGRIHTHTTLHVLTFHAGQTHIHHICNSYSMGARDLWQ